MGLVLALAAPLNLQRSYVRRILKLATISPCFRRAVVAGDESNGLSLERLTKGRRGGGRSEEGGSVFPAR